jgi:hypothetical protein
VVINSNTYYHAYIKDNAGNEAYAGRVSLSYTPIDITGPSNASLSGGGSSWLTQTTVKITGATDDSGIDSKGYCFVYSTSTNNPGSSNCGWQSSNGKIIQSQTNGYYHAYVKDTLGNETYVGYRQVKVDTTSPNAELTKSLESSFVDLVNSKFYLPLTTNDSHSGIGKVTSTNGGTYSSNKLWFPISSINRTSKSITFTYTVTDAAGNSVSKTETINTLLSYDDTLKGQLKEGMNKKLDTNITLNSINKGIQVSYTIDEDAGTIIDNLNAFGIDPNSSTVNIKYVFVSQKLSSNLNTYAALAKHTTLSVLIDEIHSPIGQKGNVYYC